MKLSVRGMALTFGLLWGGMILVVGLIATARGVHEGGYYGSDFLLLLASLYPGYDGAPELADTLIGTLYGLVDGAICGALLALLYNLFAGRRTEGASARAS